MSRFSKKKAVTATKTRNLAGGRAFTQTENTELASILLTSFATDTYYRKADDTFARLESLIMRAKDKRFAAKAAVYARNRYGMRSITHVASAIIAEHVKGEEWTKDFYAACVRRPDDITETLAYFMGKYGRTIPNSLKKGLGKSFAQFDEYQLSKYPGNGREVSLVDAVNILHPSSPKALLKKLVTGKLKTPDTWETKLSEAGRTEGGEDDVVLAKEKAWKKLIKSGKLGYFALLRNLRNIVNQSPDAIDDALGMLTDENLIRKSLVMPFRFDTAYNTLKGQLGGGKDERKVLAAIAGALDISCKNVPELKGDTCVIIDTSGSMSGAPLQNATLIGAILAKATNADIMRFSENATYISYNQNDTALTIAETVRAKCVSGGTNFHVAVAALKRKYDRLVFLSDMQGWMDGNYTLDLEFDAYCKKYGVKPHVYSIDLVGLGTSQFPKDKLYCLAGFSDRIFDTMSMLETDKNALVHEIEKVEFIQDSPKNTDYTASTIRTEKRTRR